MSKLTIHSPHISITSTVRQLTTNSVKGLIEDFKLISVKVSIKKDTDRFSLIITTLDDQMKSKDFRGANKDYYVSLRIATKKIHQHLS
jgi:ribosome-associated translation inhibitor RaiA